MSVITLFSRVKSVELATMTFRLKSLEKKFIRCSVRVLVAHLLDLIRKMLDVPRELGVSDSILSDVMKNKCGVTSASKYLSN